MLPRKHRLSKSADVKKTTAKGRGFFSPFFVIKSTLSAADKSAVKVATPKITVVVSTKVSKKAVDRNRIKRVIREQIRQTIDNIKPGNYAFLVKSSAMKVSAEDLRQAVMKSLKDAKILKS